MGYSKKIILTGYYGVGKTSLVRKYVHDSFSDEYLTTIGVKIEKKVVELDGKTMNLMIWDLAGEASTVKTPESYKKGAHGVIYVFDFTRPVTYQNIHNELVNLDTVLPNVPILIVGNKTDLLDENTLQDIKDELNLKNSFYETSAKNGVNVEKLFLDLAKTIQDADR
jgi:small GTP-binding protein